MKKNNRVFSILRSYSIIWRISPGGLSSLGNGQSGICLYDKNRATGNRAFARLINIGQWAERALAFLQTGRQKRALGMPVGNTTGYSHIIIICFNEESLYYLLGVRVSISVSGYGIGCDRMNFRFFGYPTRR